ncbi:MAG: head-tail joining protein [Pelagibacteraceae bacterium]
MAVETADDLAIFFSVDDFGVAATWTPSGGAATTVNGIFDREYLAADAGGTVAFAIEQPRLVCRTADVSTAAEGDALVVNSTNYTIKVVEPDGTGVTTLVLEEV